MSTVIYMPKNDKKPVEEQHWESEGGRPPEGAGRFTRDSHFPGSQIAGILRNLLGHLPKSSGPKKITNH